MSRDDSRRLEFVLENEFSTSEHATGCLLFGGLDRREGGARRIGLGLLDAFGCGG